MNETHTFWRHVFQCVQCKQIYDFVVEDEGDEARDTELRERLGCEVTPDGVRCDKCVGAS